MKHSYRDSVLGRLVLLFVSIAMLGCSTFTMRDRSPPPQPRAYTPYNVPPPRYQNPPRYPSPVVEESVEPEGPVEQAPPAPAACSEQLCPAAAAGAENWECGCDDAGRVVSARYSSDNDRRCRHLDGFADEWVSFTQDLNAHGELEYEARFALVFECWDLYEGEEGEYFLEELVFSRTGDGWTPVYTNIDAFSDGYLVGVARDYDGNLRPDESCRCAAGDEDVCATQCFDSAAPSPVVEQAPQDAAPVEQDCPASTPSPTDALGVIAEGWVSSCNPQGVVVSATHAEYDCSIDFTYSDNVITGPMICFDGDEHDYYITEVLELVEEVDEHWERTTIYRWTGHEPRRLLNVARDYDGDFRPDESCRCEWDDSAEVCEAFCFH